MAKSVKSFFVLDDFKFKNTVVLLRADFNVPIKDGKILDDNRIKSVIPTINYLLKNKAKIVVMSHMGRPDGKVVEELRLKIVGERLSNLVKKKVLVLKDCIDKDVKSSISNMNPGDITLLENLRFHPEEEKDDEIFAKQLASLGDLYINDAFGVSHRANASVSSITKFIPSCAGLLLQKEIDMLSKITENPEHPFIAILGGAKVSDKIGVINNLLKKADKVLIGGAMMFTFLKAQDLEIGNSKVELDKVQIAKDLLNSKKIILPIDTVIAKSRDDKDIKTVLVQHIPKDMVGLDIGPDTVKYFGTILKDAKTVFWNGPLGMFEVKAFAKGTDDVAKLISKTKAVTIIGGGETAAAVEKFKKSITHISTGGGASLEFAEGKKLPGIKVLEDNYKKFKGKI